MTESKFSDSREFLKGLEYQLEQWQRERGSVDLWDSTETFCACRGFPTSPFHDLAIIHGANDGLQRSRQRCE